MSFPSEPGPHDEQIGQILNEFLDRKARGEAVTEEELLAQHPEFADALREHLEVIGQMGVTPGEGQGAGPGGLDRTLDVRGGRPSAVSLPHDSFTGYEILREIHRGGQGVIYQAIQKATKRKVAIKVMKEGPFAGPRDKARFEREVQILGALKHPNIVAIHDSGVASGHHYFVMDYISGQPLDVWMAAKERSIEETLKLFAKICVAVNAAHLKGVIHRDLKPGNIRIDNSGEPHVLDFGLAKMALGQMTDESRPQVMTMTGQFVGSLPWASPEQAEAAPDKIDTRTDVYALGVILYQMLTGRFPYEVVGNMRDVLDRILKSEPAKPSTIRRQINDEVETIVLKCLGKERERRYQTAGELGRDVGHYLDGEPIEAKRDSGLYVLRKHLRHYKVPAAIAATFMVLIIAALVVSTALWRQAEAERLRADTEAREAQQARDQAEGATARVVAERERADVEAKEAQQARDKAERATTQAVAERKRADAEAREALQARDEAQRSTAQALAERERADQEAREAVWQAYRASIMAADASFRLGDAPAGHYHLDSCPEALRQWEWHHFNSLWDSSIVTFRGHNDSVRSVAFSPDGKRIATGSNDGTAKLWDTSTGAELITLGSHSRYVQSVAFSPDGRLIATASADKTVKLWDAITGDELNTLTGHAGGVSSVAFSKDGKRIATGALDKTVRLWNTSTGTELIRLDTEHVCSVALSPDGKRVVAGLMDFSAKVWDLTTGAELAALREHILPVYAVAYSRDGRQFATADGDGTTKVWNAASGNLLVKLRGHNSGVQSVAFSPDGRWILTGSADKTAKLWEVATGTTVTTLHGHVGWVSSASFSPDGKRIVTGSGDGTAKLWETPGKAELSMLRGPLNSVCSLAFSPGGKRIATGYRDGTAKLFDAATGDELAMLLHVPWPAGHRPEDIMSRMTVSFSPDGKRIATHSSSGHVKLWDAATVAEVASIGKQTKVVHFSPDGKRIVTGSRDGTGKLWDTATGDELVTLGGHIESVAVYSVAFSPDGKRIATGYGGRAVRRDDSLIVYEARLPEYTVKIWDAATGVELVTLGGHTDGVSDVAFSPDGRWIATGNSDDALRLWDVATGRELFTLRGHTDSVWLPTFSPDGKRILAVFGNMVRLWDTTTGAELATLRGHTDRVEAVAFSPDGKRIITGSSDRTVRLWDVVTGSEAATLRGHNSRIVSVVFSPDGKRIVTIDYAGTANFWDSTLYAERYHEIQALSNAELAASTLVERILGQVAGEYSAIRQIGGDMDLAEPVRHMALNMLLQRLDRKRNKDSNPQERPR